MRFDLTAWLNKIKYDPNSVKRDIKDKNTDVYLSKVSYRYAYFGRILCILSIILIFVFVLAGNLSYERFYYLVKDIKISANYVSFPHDTITYNTGNSQAFAVYRGGLAVASREKLAIFSASGSELLSSNHNYANPILASSNKYVLLYDVGGKQYAYGDSFSTIKQGKTEDTIYGASISENGVFALITQKDGYDSSVRIHYKNGATCEYNFASGKVISIALSDNGSKMAVMLIYPSATEIRTQIRLYNTGATEYKSIYISGIGLPLSLKFSKENGIFAVGTKGACTFSSNLTSLGEYFSESEIYSYSFGDDNIAISYVSNKGKNEIVLLNKHANISKKYSFSEKVLDVKLCGDYLFIQKLNSFERIDTAWGIKKEITMKTSNYQMLLIDKNTVVICDSAHARYINFD